MKYMIIIVDGRIIEYGLCRMNIRSIRSSTQPTYYLIYHCYLSLSFVIPGFYFNNRRENNRIRFGGPGGLFPESKLYSVCEVTVSYTARLLSYIYVCANESTPWYRNIPVNLIMDRRIIEYG